MSIVACQNGSEPVYNYSNDSIPELVDTCGQVHKTEAEKKSKIPNKETIKDTAQEQISVLRTKAGENHHEHYKAGNVSVTFFPWENNRQTIRLYDSAGKVTYTLESVRSSFSITNRFYYHSNGAVSKVVQVMRPDGGIYSQERIITFSSNNIPLLMTSKSIPTKAEDLTKPQRISKWDQNKKKWIVQ